VPHSAPPRLHRISLHFVKKRAQINAIVLVGEPIDPVAALCDARRCVRFQTTRLFGVVLRTWLIGSREHPESPHTLR
jgi:hypothetical protein